MKAIILLTLQPRMHLALGDETRPALVMLQLSEKSYVTTIVGDDNYLCLAMKAEICNEKSCELVSRSCASVLARIMVVSEACFLGCSKVG